MVQRYFALDPGERRAQAVVGAVVQREVVLVALEDAGDVEPLGLAEVSRVVVRGGKASRHGVALPDLGVGEFDVLGRVHGDAERDRARETHELVDGAGQQRRNVEGPQAAATAQVERGDHAWQP